MIVLDISIHRPQNVGYMNHTLSYQDVYLVPQYSNAHSRSEISVSVKFGLKTFRVPVVPANMKCTIDDDKAKWLSENGYFYVMHRFGRTSESRYDDMFRFVERANAEKWNAISISVGVQKEDKKFLDDCLNAFLRIDYITIDIAHGDSVGMREMLDFIKKMNTIDYTPFVIAGNVATAEGVEHLTTWGADAVKCGISNGGSCTTYGKTGFGVPQFSCVLECAKVATVPIIADGGIKTNGDIAKAIAAGATIVMAGNVFAACIDSPAEDVYAEQRAKIETSPAVIGERYQKWVTHKRYFGSASSTNKGNNHHVEGTTVLLPVDPMTYAEKLNEMTEDLQSACSYAGGTLEKLAVCPWGIR